MKKMHAFNRVENMSCEELRRWIEHALRDCKDQETKETLEAYLEGFYSDWVSLAEMACDIRDGVYF